MLCALLAALATVLLVLSWPATWLAIAWLEGDRPWRVRKRTTTPT